ncbi:MAG: FkbM family methyltransferase, partial [Candidatus Omnitrophica bacterium]|nr:FkbM family methyltransferase [Candidatus Omnitrophota bacterium]
MERLRTLFRRMRRRIIRLWRLNAAVPRLLRYNPYTGFIGRRLFQYIPFVLPHDKSYYGFAHLVHEGDGLFLDIGANDGISAIGFRHVHSDYRILSLEPNLCHERALRKLKRRLKRFEYMLLGAGRVRAQMTLYIPIYNGVPIYTAASLREDFVRRTMEEQHLPGHKGKSIVIVEYRVDIVPLDELNLKPDIIKIDTEGFDYEVLLGLVKTIESCRPPIMIEYNPDLMDQLEAFFEQRDYKLLTYEHSQDRFSIFDKEYELDLYQNQKITSNIFCVPAEKTSILPLAGTEVFSGISLI